MTLAKMWVPICLYCSNCTKFDQLILRKIIKIVATRCQILRLKCTKFDFGWGSAPADPTGGAYSAQAPPDPLAGFGGPTSKGRGRRGEGKGIKPPKSKFSGGYVAGEGTVLFYNFCLKMLSWCILTHYFTVKLQLY